MFVVKYIIAYLVNSIYFAVLMLNMGEKKEIILSKRGILGLILVILFNLAITLNPIIIPVYIKILILYVLFVSCYLFITKKTIIEGIRFAFLLLLFNFIAEMIFGLFSITILKIEPAQYVKDTTLYIISNIAIYTVSIILVSIKVIFKKVKNFLIINKKETATAIAFIIVAIMGVIANKNFYIFRNQEYILNMIITILVSLIAYYFLKESRENEKITEKYDNLFDYIEIYEKELSKSKKQTHEYKNELAAIKGLLNPKHDKNAIEYIDTIIGDFSSNESQIIRNIEKLPKGGLKGLIYYKIQIIESKGIKLLCNIVVEGKSKFNRFQDLSLYKDIMKIIGISLDNAIESCSISTKKEMIIDIYYGEEKFKMGMTNTYDHILITDKLGSDGYSTKGKKRGYGLSLIKDMLQSRKQIKYIRTAEDGLFTVEIEYNF